MRSREQQAVSYRTAAPPPPIVVALDAHGPREWGFYAIAVGLTLMALTALPGHDRSGAELARIVAGVLTTSVLVAVFGRYGRTRVYVVCQPRSGLVHLVSRGFLTRSRRRALALDDVAEVRLVPLAHVAEPMWTLAIAMNDGRIEQVFGRPIGLREADARRLVGALESLLAEARPLPPTPHLRVDTGEDDVSPRKKAARARRA